MKAEKLEKRQMVAHDVFLSYSIKDKTIADAVCAKLEENGIRVWIAPRDVPAGSNFAESIVDAIDICKVFVLIWSAEANVSKHILNEVNQAFDQGIIIIPFRIQDAQPTRAMRYYIGSTHWLDAIDPPLAEHIATLTDTILVNLGREPQDKPQPVAPEQPSTDLPIEPVQSPPQAPVTEDLIEEEKEETPSARPSPQESTAQGSKPFQSIKTTLGNLPKFVPIAAGAFIVLTLVILLVSGVFKGTPPPEIAQASPSPTAPITPTRTLTPTATATAIPAWLEEANALAEPILVAINDTPPDFADDFSQIDPAWDYWDGGGGTCAEPPTANMNIADGSIKIYVEPNCHVRLDHPYFQLLVDDFVFQVDINFSQTTNFEVGLNSSNRSVMNFMLSSGSWAISTQKLNSEDWQTVQNGPSQFDASRSAALTLLKKDTTILFYVNSVLLTSYEIQAEDADGLEFSFVVSDSQFSVRETLELDNIKFWDLDKILIAGSSQTSAWVEEAHEFAEPILALIEEHPPDFADDFSQIDPGWLYYPEEPGEEVGCFETDGVAMSITDGTMNPSLAKCRVGILIHPDMEFSNYVLQLDVNFQQTILGLEFRNWDQSPSEDGTMLMFWVRGLDGFWVFQAMENEDVLDRDEGKIGLDSSKPVTVTIINESPTFLVYVDSSLLVTYHSPQGINEGPFLLDFTVNTWETTLTEPETLVLDNVKVWDLDKIED